MAIPSLTDLLSNPAIAGVIGLIAGAFLTGLFGQAGRDTWYRGKHLLRREWWHHTDAAPELTDDELKEEVRTIAETVARAIHNGQNFRADSRIAVDPEEPYESARRQQEYVEERMNRFQEKSVPHLDYSFEEIRDAAETRDIWNSEIDDLYQNPSDFSDLRRLLICLEDIEATIPSIGN